jgi:hypothetical protein
MPWAKRTAKRLIWVRDHESRPSTGCRVIFLDVDGVLNSKATRATENKAKLSGGTSGIAPSLLAHLQEIVKQTGAYVVVSSTWREVPEKLAELTKALADCKIRIIGNTPTLEAQGMGDRVDEIRKWLSDNVMMMVEKWIVLDDLDLMKMNSKLSADHFVHTSDDIGLTGEHVVEAVQKLKGIGLCGNLVAPPCLISEPP